MNIEPKPSDREVLAGLVERVTYHNAEKPASVILHRSIVFEREQEHLDR